MTRDLIDDMRRFGNLARRDQLRELGYPVRQIRAAIQDRQIIVLRRPWLAAPAAHPDAIRAVQLGGKLAATSALRSYGVWVSRNVGVWVQAPPSSSRLPPTRRNEHRITAPERFEQVSDVRWRVSVPDALLQALRHGDLADGIASVESARYLGLVDDAVIRDMATVLPRRERRGLLRHRRGAMSGLETLFRLAAETEGWYVEIQVFIRGVGHVDVLIDGWLVIEVDGGSHAERDQMHVDRKRDSELILLGYRYHRFDHPLLMNSMDRCIAVVRFILAQGRPTVR